MTSNLTLLDDTIISLMKKYNISTQISIDGTREQHDKRRITKNGKGTYDVIMNNLKKLKEAGLKENVVIRINLDRYNLMEAENILMTVRDYSNDIYFGFLDTYKGFNDCFSDNCVSSDILPSVISNELDQLIAKYDLVVPVHFGKKSPCAMNSENKFFVDCYLNVYKCELLLNQPEASIGRISDTGTLIYSSGFYTQMGRSPMAFAECMICKLLPACAGGCAAKPYIKDNKKDGIINKKHCEITEEQLLIYLQEYVNMQ